MKPLEQVPRVQDVTYYVKTHFGDLFKQNGPSSPFRPVYPCLYPKNSHVRKIMWQASFAHDAAFWILRLPGSPYAHVTREAWNRMYYNHIKESGHPIVAWIHYQGLKIGSKVAWKRSWKKMQELGYVDLETWAAIKRTQAKS